MVCKGRKGWCARGKLVIHPVVNPVAAGNAPRNEKGA